MGIRSRREEKLKKVLKELGRNKDQVAELLKKKKIKGLQDSSYECPVARYIKRSFRNKVKAEATNATITIYFGDNSFNRLWWFDFPDEDIFIEVKTPKAVADFIDEFDNPESDKYCSLVDESNQA